MTSAAVSFIEPARVPPQNAEAEEYVSARCWLAPGAIGAVSEICRAEDFYRQSHGNIYRAALALYGRGEPVDAITLVDELDKRSELEDVGGRSRIHELAALRARERQRRSLRAHRPRDGDLARPDRRRPGDRRSRLRPPR